MENLKMKISSSSSEQPMGACIIMEVVHFINDLDEHTVVRHVNFSNLIWLFLPLWQHIRNIQSSKFKNQSWLDIAFPAGLLLLSL